MIPMTSAQSTAGFSLFDSVPNDYFHFGEGNSFRPKLVPDVLGLKREDVSKLAAVSVKSVRYDDAIPEPVRERLEEIAITVNMVAKFFDGDVDKTVTWFKARNPLLGDVSPRDMIRLGRFERLRKFIINAILDKNRVPVQEPETA
jgi:hypothetical protein